MKYVALLRGVNVGGNGKLSMSELKTVFEKAGLTNVATYINSGNIIFDSGEKNIERLTKNIEDILLKTFFAIKTVILSEKDLENIIAKIPAMWKGNDLRKYIAFVKKPSTPEDVIQAAQLKPETDFIEKGPGVVYMSTKLAGLTKSGYPKLSSKPVYKDMTIRNYNTIAKLSELMKKFSV